MTEPHPYKVFSSRCERGVGLNPTGTTNFYNMLSECCVRCHFFKNSNKRGYGYCVGNRKAYKEVFGKSFGAGAPEGPTFEVKKLFKCKSFIAAW